jgi:hypothetical protein
VFSLAVGSFANPSCPSDQYCGKAAFSRLPGLRAAIGNSAQPTGHDISSNGMPSARIAAFQVRVIAPEKPSTTEGIKVGI